MKPPLLFAVSFACAAALTAQQPAQPQPTAQPPVPATAAQAPAGQDPAKPAATPETKTPAAPVPADGEGALTFHVHFDAASGTLQQTTTGDPARSGDTGALFVRLGFEMFGKDDFGGGLRVEGVRSDDELYLDTGGVRSEGTDAELFLHASGYFGDQDAGATARLGVFSRTYDDKNKGTGIQREWSAVGIRAEFEPEFALHREQGLRWSLGGRVSGCFGLATASSDPASFEADTHVVGVDLEVSTKVRLNAFEFGLGYLHRQLAIDESDEVGGARFPAVDLEFRGLMVSFALVF